MRFKSILTDCEITYPRVKVLILQHGSCEYDSIVLRYVCKALDVRVVTVYSVIQSTYP